MYLVPNLVQLAYFVQLGVSGLATFSMPAEAPSQNIKIDPWPSKSISKHMCLVPNLVPPAYFLHLGVCGLATFGPGYRPRATHSSESPPTANSPFPPSYPAGRVPRPKLTQRQRATKYTHCHTCQHAELHKRIQTRKFLTPLGQFTWFC